MTRRFLCTTSKRALLCVCFKIKSNTQTLQVTTHWLLCFYSWRTKLSAYFHLCILPLEETHKTYKAYRHQLPPDVQLYIRNSHRKQLCGGVCMHHGEAFYHNYKTNEDNNHPQRVCRAVFRAYSPHLGSWHELISKSSGEKAFWVSAPETLEMGCTVPFRLSVNAT